MSNPRKNELKKIFMMLCHSRYFQEKLLEVGIGSYTEIGEEAITIGSYLGLKKTDIMSVYFRGEGSVLRLKGGINLRDQMAWWLGRKGENSPVTAVLPSAWIDVEHGVIGTTSSLIGADGDMCCGAALAQKLQKTGKVVLFLVGDGATSKGNFHEVLNFSSLYKLPLIIMVRGNRWAMSTAVERNCAYQDITELAFAFGIPTAKIEGNDINEVQNQVQSAAAHARSGDGPFLIYARTYRMSAHSPNDEDDYRSEDEKKEWEKKDPLKIATEYLIKKGMDISDIEKIKRECRQEIDDAYEWALKRPVITPEEILKKQESCIKQMWGRT